GATGGGTVTQASYAGILRLTFFNHDPTAAVIADGAFRARIEGSYHYVPSPGGVSSTFAAAVLQATTQTGTAVARGDHTVGISYDGAGAVIGTNNIFTKVIESGGARVPASGATPSVLAMELVMPKVAIAPGGSMAVTFLLQINTSNAAADFTATPATLRLTLPRGISLDSDSAVPLEWVDASP